MPVPSQGHYGFPRFPVIDRFCLFVYLRNNNSVFEELELSIVDCSVIKYCTIGLMTFARYFNICWDQNNTYRDFECCFVVWTKKIGKQTTLFL
jgi:hypothetical protein